VGTAGFAHRRPLADNQRVVSRLPLNPMSEILHRLPEFIGNHTLLAMLFLSVLVALARQRGFAPVPRLSRDHAGRADPVDQSRQPAGRRPVEHAGFREGPYSRARATCR
jgi:hypothetical protein